MIKLLARLKHHAEYYYLYYALSYLLTFPLLIKIFDIWYSKNFDAKSQLYAFAIGNILLVIASGIKHNTKLSKLISGTILLFGMILNSYYYIYSVFKIIPVINSKLFISLLFSLVISIWLALLFFIDITQFNKKINKTLIVRILLYYVILAISLYAFTISTAIYYINKYESIISKGSRFIVNGLNYNQIRTLIESARYQSAIILSILVILHLVIFFIIFRQTLKNISIRH